MATTIIFSSSLLMAALLLLVKMIEIRKGSKNKVLSFLGRLDALSDRIVSAAKFKCLQAVQSIRYVFLVKIKEILHDLLQRTKEKILNEYTARQNVIMMGHKEFTNKGSASFYLKKIIEQKTNGEKGKIDDDDLPEG